MGEHIAAGRPAPAFALPDQDGNPLTLSDFAGRPLAIFFYPKDDTAGCTAEALEFSALAAAFRDGGVALLGISPDPPKRHLKFRMKHGLDLRLGSDEAKTMCLAYGVWVEKRMYGRIYMGVERTTVLVTRDGLVARVWPRVTIAGHAAEVLAAALALEDGPPGAEARREGDADGR